MIDAQIPGTAFPLYLLDYDVRILTFVCGVVPGLRISLIIFREPVLIFTAGLCIITRAAGHILCVVCRKPGGHPDI